MKLKIYWGDRTHKLAKIYFASTKCVPTLTSCEDIAAALILWRLCCTIKIIIIIGVTELHQLHRRKQICEYGVRTDVDLLREHRHSAFSCGFFFSSSPQLHLCLLQCRLSPQPENAHQRNACHQQQQTRTGRHTSYHCRLQRAIPPSVWCRDCNIIQHVVWIRADLHK